jgi:tetratricopeptide (TPR) repeat protein
MTPRSVCGRSLALAAGTVLALAITAATAAASPCRWREAETLLAAQRISDARQILEQCAGEDPPDPKVAHALGQTYLLLGDQDHAVFWLEKAASLDSGNSDYQLWLGRAYGAQALRASALRQPALARKVRRAFEQAVVLDPDNLAARLSLVEYDLRAPSFLGGSVEKAREQAEEIRRRDPLRGHRALGLIAEHEKRFDLAAEEYERAIREFPGTPDPVYWRAGLAERQKDDATAFELLEMLAAPGRSEPAALYRIGELAASSGQRLERGEESLKLYLEHRPTRGEPSLALAHYRLGRIYDRKRDRASARREYTAALELEPTLTEARQALARAK